MKTNTIIIAGCMSIVFGAYIGMCESQWCFVPIIMGIIILLSTIRKTQIINQ